MHSTAVYTLFFDQAKKIICNRNYCRHSNNTNQMKKNGEYSLQKSCYPRLASSKIVSVTDLNSSSVQALFTYFSAPAIRHKSMSR